MASEQGVKVSKKIFVGIKGEADSFVESRGMAKFVSGVGPAPAPAEEMSEPAIVINRLDHPMTLSYGGDAMVVPPRGRVKIASVQKLGGLPKGIQLVPFKG